MDNYEHREAIKCLSKTLQVTKNYLEVNRDVLDADEVYKLQHIIADSEDMVRRSEFAYIIECLNEAVNYAELQYHTSGIDWLPSNSFLNYTDEADKFKMLKDFINAI